MFIAMNVGIQISLLGLGLAYMARSHTIMLLIQNISSCWNTYRWEISSFRGIFLNSWKSRSGSSQVMCLTFPLSTSHLAFMTSACEQKQNRTEQRRLNQGLKSLFWSNCGLVWLKGVSLSCQIHGKTNGEHSLISGSNNPNNLNGEWGLTYLIQPTRYVLGLWNCHCNFSDNHIVKINKKNFQNN